jgi:hypothetical protein
MLYNKITKKYLCIAKHLGGPWYISNRIKDLEEFLSDEKNQEAFWKDEHTYELRYEDDPNFEGENFPGVRSDNRPENLELWTSRHPSGVNHSDKIKSSIAFLEEEGYKVSK